jgi:hypothetical protein
MLEIIPSGTTLWVRDSEVKEDTPSPIPTKPQQKSGKWILIKNDSHNATRR